MKKYDSYKDSGFQWYGSIPSNWNILPMKYLFDIYSGATPDTGKDEYWDGDINWITPADYKTEDYYVGSGRKKITEKGYQSCGTSLLPIGSIVFSKRAPIGTVALTSTELCTNQGCLGCVPKNVNAKYYYYSMSVLRDQFELFGSGSTFKEISATDFSNFKMLVPPLKEQNEIVSFLERKCSIINELINYRNYQIQELEKFKQLTISEVVTHGLTFSTEMKDVNSLWIKKIPSNWDLTKMKYLFVLKTGTTPKAFEDQKDNDILINWYTPSDVKENGNVLGPSERKLAKRIIEDAKIQLNPEESIYFVGIGATAGKVGFASQEGYSNQQLTALVPKVGNSKYFFYYLCSSKKKVRDNALFTTLPIINNAYLSQVMLPNPPIDEQNAIVNYLDQKCENISKLLELLDKEIKELEKYKTAIICEAVTGKVKVF